MRKVGPYITLIDVETTKELSLHVGLAPKNLLDLYQTIKPNSSVSFNTKIMKYELTEFRKEVVNLDVRVEFSGSIKSGEGEPKSFNEIKYFRIMACDAWRNQTVGTDGNEDHSNEHKCVR